MMTCMNKYTKGEKRERLRNVVSPEGDFLVTMGRHGDHYVVWRAPWLGASLGWDSVCYPVPLVLNRTAVWCMWWW